MIDATNPTTRTHSIAAQTLNTLPSFVLDTFPDFRKFLAAYLAWSESVGNPSHLIGLIRSARDLDTSPAEFMALLQKEYAPSLSAERTSFGDTGKSLNYSKFDASFLKNIRQFYLAKGTPGSFIWLFNTLYNLQTSIQSAGQNVLRPSSAEWSSPFIMYVCVNDNNIVLPAENVLRDISASVTLKKLPTNEKLIECATITGVQIISRNANNCILAIHIDKINFQEDIINQFISEVSSNDLKVLFGVVYDESQLNSNRDLTTWNNLLHPEEELTIRYTISKIKIINGGLGWLNGEKITINPLSENTSLRSIFIVSTVNSQGAIRNLNDIQIGFFGDIETPEDIKSYSFNVQFESQNGTNPEIDYTIGIFSKPSPVLISSTSIPSDSFVVIRDMYRYHDNAYIIKTLNGPIPSNFNKQEYIEFAHPAGMGWFIEEAVGTGFLSNKIPSSQGFETLILQPQIEIPAATIQQTNKWQVIGKFPY